MYCDMYREILFFIFIYTKTVYGRLFGESKEESTETPTDIDTLTFDEWCKFQPNAYDCGGNRSSVFRYYFDAKLSACKATAVGDCGDNPNKFWDLRECNELCRAPGKRDTINNLTANVYCRLQYEFGFCQGYHPMWYYDVSTRTCKGFSYSGCGGNQNKFATSTECRTTCIPNVNYTAVNVF